MGIQLKQLGDGSMGLEGKDLDTGAFVTETSVINAASTATQIIFTATRSLRVQGIRYRVEVSGTGGACTFVINKAPSGTAISGGTTVHTGTFNVAGTAATTQTGVISTTTGVANLAVGDSLGLIITGTPTSAIGAVTMFANPL